MVLRRAVGDTARFAHITITTLEGVEVDGVDGVGGKPGGAGDDVGVARRGDLVVEADVDAALELGQLARDGGTIRQVRVAPHQAARLVPDVLALALIRPCTYIYSYTVRKQNEGAYMEECRMHVQVRAMRNVRLYSDRTGR